MEADVELPGVGILQKTNDLNGTWIDILDADTPYVLPLTVPRMFFRATEQ